MAADLLVVPVAVLPGEFPGVYGLKHFWLERFLAAPVGALRPLNLKMAKHWCDQKDGH